jgi:putative ABC transport system permease protein
MSRVFFLAWRYVAYYRLKTAILVAGLTLTILLPLATHLVIRHFDAALKARAIATPLIVGAKGNRFDLALKTLYFSSAAVDAVRWSDYEAVLESGLASAIPIEASYTARGNPIVGTSIEYFDFRKLRASRGTLFTRIGECVIGSHVAAVLRIGPGDALFSDQAALYDISKSYPLKMHVTGVLAHSGTADDFAVFVDVQTAWIIGGISHGHGDVTRIEAPGLIALRDANGVRTTDAIVEYNEVTDDNVASFHMHAAPAERPLTSIIVLPADRKSETILRARYREPERSAQMLEPLHVVDELMERVFEVQRIFNLAFGLVALSTLLFLVLVVLLSQRLRAREMETMRKIGCSRAMTTGLQCAELAIVVGISVVLAAGLSQVVVLAAPHVVRLTS